MNDIRLHPLPSDDSSMQVCALKVLVEVMTHAKSKIEGEPDLCYIYEEHQVYLEE